MGQTITNLVTLEAISCCECGIVFAMPDYMKKWRLCDGGLFYCPNGHSQRYSESELQRVQKKLADQTRIATQMAERARLAESSEEAARKKLKRAEKRYAAGVCPCCNRKFQSLARHMSTKHPEYTP